MASIILHDTCFWREFSWLTLGFRRAPQSARREWQLVGLRPGRAQQVPVARASVDLGDRRHCARIVNRNPSVWKAYRAPQLVPAVSPNMEPCQGYLCSAPVGIGALAAWQYWGGMGFMWDNLVSRAYRDLRLTSIGGGSDEMMLGIICKLMGTLPRGGPG